jgi:phosphomannomutase
LTSSRIVKAYEVRGTVPYQLDEQVAKAIGTAFVRMLRASGQTVDRIVTAHDMRASSPALAAAFAAGATEAGVSVVAAGLGSTDMLYYASGALDLPGAMFTASHNPARYNGIKMCRSGAKPIGQDTGLTEIRERAQAILDGTAEQQAPAGTKGTVEERDLLTEYALHLRSLVDLSGIRELSVVVDAGNGMGGYTVPAVLGDGALAGLPLRITPMYFELDGTFPNHEANPLEAKNIVDRCASTARTSGSPSTATPTAVSWSTSAATPCRRRRSPRSSRCGSWPRTPAPR